MSGAASGRGRRPARGRPLVDLGPSTAGERGPQPHPGWLVTELAAIDTELGVLKTGKEADVFLLRRGVPGAGRSCLLAAKRYRGAEHRMFHRDSGYLEGRRVRGSRENRAMASRTAFGRRDDRRPVGERRVRRAVPSCSRRASRCRTRCRSSAPSCCWSSSASADGTAAPRLAETRPGRRRAGRALGPAGRGAARAWPGTAWRTATCRRTTCWCTTGRLVMIDLPQVVDVIANPRGAEFLDRDAANIARWLLHRARPDRRPSGTRRTCRPAPWRSPAQPPGGSSTTGRSGG